MNFGMGARPITVWLEKANRVGDLTIEDERVIYDCTWAPQLRIRGAAAESMSSRSDLVSSGIVLYAPSDCGLTAQHRVRLAEDDPTVWRVDGDPEHFYNPIGATQEGVQAHLERITG